MCRGNDAALIKLKECMSKSCTSEHPIIQNSNTSTRTPPKPLRPLRASWRTPLRRSWCRTSGSVQVSNNLSWPRRALPTDSEGNPQTRRDFGWVCSCDLEVASDGSSQGWVGVNLFRDLEGQVKAQIFQTLHVWHICLHWGGLGGQCRHIWHTCSVWVFQSYGKRSVRLWFISFQPIRPVRFFHLQTSVICRCQGPVVPRTFWEAMTGSLGVWANHPSTPRLGGGGTQWIEFHSRENLQETLVFSPQSYMALFGFPLKQFWKARVLLCPPSVMSGQVAVVPPPARTRRKKDEGCWMGREITQNTHSASSSYIYGA